MNTSENMRELNLTSTFQLITSIKERVQKRKSFISNRTRFNLTNKKFSSCTKALKIDKNTGILRDPEASPRDLIRQQSPPNVP